MKEMKNRVYGVIGIKTKNGNFNAGMDTMPRQNPASEYFASDKALKYACRRYWVDNGEKVFAFKSYKEAIEKQEGEEVKVLIPKNIKDRYESFFGTISKKGQDEIISNLSGFLDINNFGVTFPVNKNNLSVTGVAQLDLGINKFKNTKDFNIECISPYQNPNKDDNKNTSIGNKNVITEAHYFYNLTVNPKNLDSYEGFFTYKESDYEKLKEGLMKGVTALNTQTKISSQNEFGMFVKLKEDSKLYIPCLTEYIDFISEGEKNIIDFSKLSFLKEYLSQIDSIEIIYNQITTELNNLFESEKITVKSIFDI